MQSRTSHKIPNERIQKLHRFLKRLNIVISNAEFKNLNNQSHLALLDEALTHTSAKTGINHERLEFLGDAVLRLTASEFIEWNFPNMKVGDRSELRAQLVSDKWLTKVGRRIGIKEMLIVGPKAAKDTSACATIEAETTEALIGALYECFQNLKPIHDWLTPYWKETSNAVLSDPDKHNSKSALQEWIQARGLSLPNYEIQEICKKHGDPRRFFCKVHLEGKAIGEGWGGSRKEAEKEAANSALKSIKT